MPWFLDVLGVDSDADVVAIRKAYAKAIKECDRASEAERFQEIRQAYELALQWVEQPGDHPFTSSWRIFESAPEEQASPIDSARGESHQVASSRLRMDGASSSPIAAARDFEKELLQEGNDAAYELLDKFSEDDRLIALDDKFAFEQLVLAMCFAAPTNIALLDAASDRYEWNVSSRHLTARADLTLRLKQHLALRDALSANMSRDAKEFEEAINIYRSFQGKPRGRVQPWRIVWANRLMERYDTFRGELAERYGEQALDWWSRKLESDPALRRRADSRRAAQQGFGGVLRSPALSARKKFIFIACAMALFLAAIGRWVL
ncbi:J domain-containing protein [Dyella mobilis]|uniref:J domain-containing protein n=1 Tax=Dyella mobilis TaxID=1849582 RepID=A0ABS2KDJ5_9GAMM|nr:J domain-containing protein [Dyella mobilis]MBM7129251.1 hypothetical protein [Dyella mobilis]GLQ98545.1 hypothetical protein GCM10007863_29650 [Dyella mobilis]